MGDFSVGNGFSIAGGSGNDTLSLATNSSYRLKVGGNAAFSLGAGENVMAWNGSADGESVRITGLGGVDTVYVSSLSAPNAVFSADLGGGEDTIRMGSAFLRATLNGSSGNDAILDGGSFPANKTIKKFEIGLP